MLNLQARLDEEQSSNIADSAEKEQFINDVIHEAALASNNYREKSFDLPGAKRQCSAAMKALGVSSGLQAMLAAQMLSMHQLQQKSMAYANAASDMRLIQYYTSTSIKLSSCFVQQANILAKLQGVGGQKIIVERVDVHDGGQAIVGNVHGG